MEQRLLRPAHRSSTTTQREAREAERKAQHARTSTPGRVLGRVGLLSRAAIYFVLGYLSADIAAGSARNNASSQGALGAIARQTAGSALVALLAGGFFAYAGWRLLQAAGGDENEEGGTEVLRRLGWAGIGGLYIVLGVRAFLILAAPGSGNNSAFSASRTLLDAGGPALLGAVGLGVVAAGLALSIWAVGHDFTKRLNPRHMPEALLFPSRLVESFGNVVRGLAFAGIGATMVVAAVSSSAKEAKGLNGVLHSLMGQPFGSALLAVVSAGFFAFGLASLLEALYRNVATDRG